jgi:hypothetical protein
LSGRGFIIDADNGRPRSATGVAPATYTATKYFTQTFNKRVPGPQCHVAVFRDIGVFRFSIAVYFAYRRLTSARDTRDAYGVLGTVLGTCMTGLEWRTI